MTASERLTLLSGSPGKTREGGGGQWRVKGRRRSGDGDEQDVARRKRGGEGKMVSRTRASTNTNDFAHGGGGFLFVRATHRCSALALVFLDPQRRRKTAILHAPNRQ